MPIRVDWGFVVGTGQIQGVLKLDCDLVCIVRSCRVVEHMAVPASLRLPRRANKHARDHQA